MKRAVPWIALVLAVLVTAWWSTTPPSSPSAEALAPSAAVAPEPAPENVAVAGESEGAPRRETVEVSPSATAPEAPEVVASAPTPLAAGEAELIVHVVSREEKKPVAGVRLFLQPFVPKEHFGAVHIEGSLAKVGEAPITDEAGTARFVLASGDAYKVATVQTERIGSTNAEVPALAAGESRVIVLEGSTQEDAHFFGRLIADEDESPITNARVEVTDGHFWSSDEGNTLTPSGSLPAEQGPVERSFVPEADGLFGFPFSSWKHERLRILAPGRSLLLSDLPHGHETAQKALAIRIQRSASLEARVVDAVGAGILGIAVRVSTEAYLLRRQGIDWFGGIDPAWESSTGTDGRCRLIDLPAGAALTTELVRDGKVLRRDLGAFTLAPGEAKTIELALGGGTRLRGRIVDQDGKPVSRHEVWLKRAESLISGTFQEYEEANAKTRSDAEGSFVFEDVPVGDWWVGPAPRSRHGAQRALIENDCAPVAELAHVVDGVAEVEVIVRTHRGLLIRGHILDPEGRPAGEGHVFATAVGRRSYVNAQTEGDGSFVLGPLGLDEYQVVANGAYDSTNSPSELTPARAGDLDLVLRLRPGGKFEGRVVDGASGALCDATLTVSRVDADAGDFGGMWGTSTREDKFTIPRQPLGTYSIAARTSDGKYGEISALTLEAGQTRSDIEIVVEPGATLRVRCVGEKGHGNFRILSGDVCVGFDGVPAGGVSEQTVPAGTLVIKAFTGRNLPTSNQTIVISKGETREIVIQPYE